jgi:hypothetical protein
MSNEQSRAPQSDQPNWYGQASFIPGEQVDFHKSDLESIDILQARQAIAAAVASIPSGGLEVKTPEIERQSLTPSQEMRKIGRMLGQLRVAFDDNTFNLEEDDDVSVGMFNTPKPDTTDVSKSDVDLAA